MHHRRDVNKNESCYAYISRSKFHKVCQLRKRICLTSQSTAHRFVTSHAARHLDAPQKVVSLQTCLEAFDGINSLKAALRRSCSPS